MSSLPLQRALYPLLSPLGKAYAFFMRQRRRRYQRGQCKQFVPGVPCVAVGNIGWGGSGKTPLVDWLLSWAGQKSKKAVVLSRGYKGKPPLLPYHVQPDSTPRQAGDEPCMLARKHPAAAIVVDPVRSRSGAWAERTLTPDLFILDDGFQHLAVQRHADIVLLKKEDLADAEWNRVIPSGSWREEEGALRQAAAFCIKVPDVQAWNKEQNEQPKWLHQLNQYVPQRLEALGKPVFPFSLEPRALVCVSGSNPEQQALRLPLQEVSVARPSSGCSSAFDIFSEKKEYILMTGVGAPQQVYETVTRCVGTPPVHHAIFADHHAYTVDDVMKLARHGAPLLCTPKDAVKLPFAAMQQARVECWTMELDVVFGPPWFCDTTFPLWWDTIWQSLSEPMTRQAMLQRNI